MQEALAEVYAVLHLPPCMVSTSRNDTCELTSGWNTDNPAIVQAGLNLLRVDERIIEQRFGERHIGQGQHEADATFDA